MAQHSTCCTDTSNELSSFSNADHLEWNQKKQDMILNLGLTNQSDTDQTPTPTRFIRNCEEVGLFQDLQNVNPFDEVFKKAVENPTSMNLQAPTNTSDDTLHTPQIYPELDECPKFSCNNDSTPGGYSLNIDPRDDDDNPLIIVLEPDKENETSNTSEQRNVATETNTREKIKAAIIQKSACITPVPLDRLLEHKKESPKNGKQTKSNTMELLKQREANKAAQSRCRKRKQKEFEDIKSQNKLLKNENMRLTAVNFDLQKTIKRLQEELREARLSNNVTDNQLGIDERISAVSIDQFYNKTNCDKASKTTSMMPNNNNEMPLEGTALQNSPNMCVQYSPTMAAAPVILNKSVGSISGPAQLPPIAPKNLVLSMPAPNISSAVGIPLQNMQHSSNTVVLVYPVASKSVIVPSK